MKIFLSALLMVIAWAIMTQVLGVPSNTVMYVVAGAGVLGLIMG